MTMETVSTEQGTENMEYVRRLLRQKQPGFSTALELAVAGVERELLSAAVPPGGFARDFGTADGERVMVAALTQQQFADLAMTTRLASFRSTICLYASSVVPLNVTEAFQEVSMAAARASPLAAACCWKH